MFLYRFALAVVLIGCAATSDIPAQQSVPVTELFSSRNCRTPAKEFQARWIDDPGQIASIPGWPIPAAPGSNGPSQWDPQEESRLWIHMGQKPTGGYSLHLARPEAKIENGIAKITVQVRQPPPDAFVTQVITSPCLVLKIGKGKFHTIQIQDQKGDIRATIKKSGT